MKKSNIKWAFQLALVFCAVCYAGVASATHKNWVLKNGGSECTFQNPGPQAASTGTLVNSIGISRTAVCPMALAGRWGGTAGTLSFNPQLWAASIGAAIYFDKKQSSSTISCHAVGTFSASAGAKYWGMTVTNNGAAGVQRLELATQRPNTGGGSTWGDGSDLETHDRETLHSLSFVCTVPGDGTAIIGHRVKICQLTADCWDDGQGAHEGSDDAPQIGTSTLFNYIQVSGVECAPEGTAGIAGLQRTATGMSNTGNTAARVFCPLPPPSDDSYEHGRTINTTKVYFSGGATPDCKLRWWARGQTAAQESASFTQIGDFVYKINSWVAKELYAGVSCSLPAGVTITGVMGEMDVGGISGGM